MSTRSRSPQETRSSRSKSPHQKQRRLQTSDTSVHRVLRSSDRRCKRQKQHRQLRVTTPAWRWRWNEPRARKSLSPSGSERCIQNHHVSETRNRAFLANENQKAANAKMDSRPWLSSKRTSCFPYILAVRGCGAKDPRIQDPFQDEASKFRKQRSWRR